MLSWIRRLTQVVFAEVKKDGRWMVFWRVRTSLKPPPTSCRLGLTEPQRSPPVDSLIPAKSAQTPIPTIPSQSHRSAFARRVLPRSDFFSLRRPAVHGRTALLPKVVDSAFWVRVGFFHVSRFVSWIGVFHWPTSTTEPSDVSSSLISLLAAYPLPSTTPQAWHWTPVTPYPFRSDVLSAALPTRCHYLDISDHRLAPPALEELLDYLQTHPFAKGLLRIVWDKVGDHPLDENTQCLRQAIESQLTVNREHFVNTVFVDDYTCARLSQVVYDDSGYDAESIEPTLPPLPKGYRLLMMSNQNASVDGNGYFGAAYINDETGQVVVAHRGTEGISRLREFLADWRTNIQEIVLLGRRTNSQLSSAVAFTHCAAQVAKQLGYRITVTGHSLGGWLAQMSTVYLHVQEDTAALTFSERPRAVVFDSPGIQETLTKQLAAALENQSGAAKQLLHRIGIETAEDLATFLPRLAITAYLSRPNLVNTCQTHVGEVYELMLQEPDGPVGKLTVLSYTQAMHAMDRLLRCFDPQTGKPRQGTAQRIQRWPKIRFELTGLALWKWGLFYPLASLLDQKTQRPVLAGPVHDPETFWMTPEGALMARRIQAFLPTYQIDTQGKDPLRAAWFNEREQRVWDHIRVFQLRKTQVQGEALNGVRAGEANESAVLQSVWLGDLLQFSVDEAMDETVPMKRLVHHHHTARDFQRQMALLFACYPSLQDEATVDQWLRRLSEPWLRLNTPSPAVTNQLSTCCQQAETRQRGLLKVVNSLMVLQAKPLGHIYSRFPLGPATKAYEASMQELVTLRNGVEEAQRLMESSVRTLSETGSTPPPYVLSLYEGLKGQRVLLDVVQRLNQAGLYTVKGELDAASKTLETLPTDLERYQSWLARNDTAIDYLDGRLMGRFYQQLGKLARRHWRTGDVGLRQCATHYETALTFLPQARDLYSNLGAVNNDHGEWYYQTRCFDALGEYRYRVDERERPWLLNAKDDHQRSLIYHQQAHALDPFDPQGLRDYGRGVYLLGLVTYQLSDQKASARQAYLKALETATTHLDSSLQLFENIEQKPPVVGYLFRGIVKMEKARVVLDKKEKRRLLQSALNDIEAGLEDEKKLKDKPKEKFNDKSPSHPSLLRRRGLIKYLFAQDGVEQDRSQRSQWLTEGLEDVDRALEVFDEREKTFGFLTPEDQVRKDQTGQLQEALRYQLALIRAEQHNGGIQETYREYKAWFKGLFASPVNRPPEKATGMDRRVEKNEIHKEPGPERRQ